MKHWKKSMIMAVVSIVFLLGCCSAALAAQCIAPDNGAGTVDLPAPCPYTAPDGPMYIIDGLPPGTTIEIDPVFENFTCNPANGLCSIVHPPGDCENPGGALGGDVQCFDGMLTLTMTGTGTLAGFNRTLLVPAFSEIHSAPRTPGDSQQTFETDMFLLQGEIFGDPDFCTFRIRGGSAPGQIILTENPPGGDHFNVDSFFDIGYQIEFVGCPGSVLEGFGGTTTQIVRWQQGEPNQCKADLDCAEFQKVNIFDLLRMKMGYNNTGCDALDPLNCCAADIDTTGASAGRVDIFDLLLMRNEYNHTCAPCQPACACIAADNGAGTVDLPAPCPYIAPDDVMYIIDGLPPDTTIEIEPVFENFTCNPVNGLCSIVHPPGDCENPGGALGGDVQCFDGMLTLTMTGTGALAGFNRTLFVPAFSEIHSAPRTPGDSQQTFETDMFLLQGEIFGDPDFCTFRIRGGTLPGLPGPGQTTLKRVSSGDFAVDSFFDITYQIEFVGCPGSVLEGFAGTTTATIRWDQVFAGP